MSDVLNHQRGAWAEAIAAAWLIERGWEVFSGLSGQESCDMVALNHTTGEMVRVEVKAGTPNPTNDKLAISVKHPEAYDVLLVVAPSGEVIKAAPGERVTGLATGTGRGGHNAWHDRGKQHTEPCACGNEVLAKGLCYTCYHAERRNHPQPEGNRTG